MIKIRQFLSEGLQCGILIAIWVILEACGLPLLWMISPIDIDDYSAIFYMPLFFLSVVVLGVTGGVLIWMRCFKKKKLWLKIPMWALLIFFSAMDLLLCVNSSLGEKMGEFVFNILINCFC